VAWALVALLSPREAVAQVPATPTHTRVRLAYSVPPELTCPDRETFASAIATRLGYEAVVTDGAGETKTLDVQFRQEQKAIRATLRLVNAANETESEKTIVSETGACAELGAAAAFAAAILLDPRAMFPRPGQAAPPVAPPAWNSPGTSPFYEPPPPFVPPAPPPPAAPWRWRAGAGVGPCIGCAPEVSVGAALLLGVAKGRLGLDGGVRADLPTSASAASGATVSSSLVVGELFPHARLGPVRLGVVGSAGSLFGDSNGEKQASLVAAVGPRVAVEWTVAGPVFLRAALDGAVALSRVSLRVEGMEVWSTPALTAGANLGGGVEF
jgi:hypothetical protein